MDPLQAIFRVATARSATAALPTASVDLDRHRRCGFPEVVFGQGKSIEQLREILATLAASGEDAFATRIDAEQAAGLAAAFPQRPLQRRGPHLPRAAETSRRRIGDRPAGSP